MKKVFIGSDHGGYELKGLVKDYLVENSYEPIDLGCDSTDSCDYPGFGRSVARAVVENPGNLGIVICGSGIGISIAANRIAGARCALCNSVEMAELGRAHNGANVLAMGERTTFIDAPLKIVEAFLNTKVDDSDRHTRRRAQLDEK